jgi:hypothetical protein
MNSLQPRQVETNAPLRWAREALGLIGRRPGAFALSGLAALVLFCAVLQIEQAVIRFIIVLIVPPALIGGFIRMAEAADMSRPLHPAAALPTNREAVTALAVTAVGYGLIFAAILAMGVGTTGYGLPLEPGLLADPRWRDYVQTVASAIGLPFVLVVKSVLFGTSLAAFSGLLLVLFAWFALPLMQLGNVRSLLALRLSMDAYRLNARRIGLSSVGVLAAMAAVVVLTLGVAAVLAAPFLGAMLYVSYREVFLGQAENSPAQAAALPMTDAAA